MSSPCGKCDQNKQQSQQNVGPSGCACPVSPAPAPSASCGYSESPAPTSTSSAVMPAPTKGGCTCSVTPVPAKTAQPAQPAPQPSMTGQAGCARSGKTKHTTQKPKMECLCANNRTRGNAIQAPLADSYTCSRPRQEERPIEDLCTCKTKETVVVPPSCECSAHPAAQTHYQQSAQHSNITCGQRTAQSGPTPYVRQGHSQCGHCSRQTKKKCVIQ